MLIVGKEHAETVRKQFHGEGLRLREAAR
jgi:hypothetical protein